MKDSIKNPTNCQELIDDTLEIQCDECGIWHEPNEWGRFCSEECLEAYDCRLSEIERKEREEFWENRVFNEWLPQHMETWRKLQNLRNGSTPTLTRQS